MNRFKNVTAKVALSLAFVMVGTTLPATVFANDTNDSIPISYPLNSSAVSWNVQPAISFPDVAATHWAFKDVAKLSMLGIVKGDNLGKFTPNKSVSQQDVLVMSVRMLGLDKEVAAQNVDSLVFPFGLSNYAKPYIKVALDHQLIDLSEIPEGDNSWGTTDSSREWIAKIMIRLIDREESAELKTFVPSTFKDGNEISIDNAGYVTEAVELKIVNGYVDNTFKPKGTVTRAEATALLSRAANYLTTAPGYPISGTIVTLEASKVLIMDDEGNTLTFSLSTDTLAYNGTNKLAAGALKVGNMIDIIANDSAAYFIELIKEQGPVISNGEGIVSSALTEGSKISVSTSNGVLEYIAAEKAVDILKTAKVGDKLRYQLFGNAIISAQVIPVINGNLFGIVKDGASPYLTLSKADGKLESIRLTADVKVSSPIKANASLSDLYIGDKLAIELDANGNASVIDVIISSMTTHYMTKVVYPVNKSKQLVVTNRLGESVVYTLDDKIVIIDDKGIETSFHENLYSMLVEGIRIDMTVTGNKVLKIKLSTTYSGVITKLDLNTGEVIIKMKDNSLLPFTIKQTSVKVITVTGKPGILNDLEVGKNVEVSYDMMSVNNTSQIRLLP